mmetsp:Transcript_89458/g.289567  ORF Transcript_89458/g.289567 Transcript_89458/m.289567 type:complete len:293 (-) Transcript_89458:181-1059(-)
MALLRHRSTRRANGRRLRLGGRARSRGSRCTAVCPSSRGPGPADRAATPVVLRQSKQRPRNWQSRWTRARAVTPGPPSVLRPPVRWPVRWRPQPAPPAHCKSSRPAIKATRHLQCTAHASDRCSAVPGPTLCLAGHCAEEPSDQSAQPNCHAAAHHKAVGMAAGLPAVAPPSRRAAVSWRLWFSWWILANDLVRSADKITPVRGCHCKLQSPEAHGSRLRNPVAKHLPHHRWLWSVTHRHQATSKLEGSEAARTRSCEPRHARHHHPCQACHRPRHPPPHPWHCRQHQALAV